ncbi:MAG: MFS transporter [Pseudomonadota bacterium]
MPVHSDPDAPTGTVRWSEILNRRYGPSLLLVCLGVWLHAADSLVVATKMPAIIAEIGGADLVAWNVSLYEIGSIVAGAASGLLSLRYGIRNPMSVAALLFAVGCLTSVAAPTMPVMLLGRLLQGLGGGGLVSLSFVAVGLLFPKRLIARAMAAISTLWGISAFLGPLAGGFFVEFFTWRIGFMFFAVQALLLALWIRFGARDFGSGKSKAEGGSFPVMRLMCLCAGVVLIAYGGIDVSPVKTGILIAAGLAMLGAFLAIDARKDADRLLPMRPFDLRRPAGAALLMILAFSAGTIAITAYGPLLVTMLHDTSALTAGYIVACSSIGWTVVAVSVSGFSERHDPTLIAGGMLLVTASIFGFAWSVPNGPVWLIAVISFVEGGGFGMAWTFILRRTTAFAPAADTERVAAAIPTVQRFGYAVGAAYAGIVANATGFGANAPTETLSASAMILFLACLPLAAVGLVAMAAFIRPPVARPVPGDA